VRALVGKERVEEGSSRWRISGGGERASKREREIDRYVKREKERQRKREEKRRGGKRGCEQEKGREREREREKERQRKDATQHRANTMIALQNKLTESQNLFLDAE